jgi:hypothetical protein
MPNPSAQPFTTGEKARQKNPLTHKLLTRKNFNRPLPASNQQVAQFQGSG